MTEATGQLRVQGLQVHIGKSHILQDLDLKVGAQPLALVGRNGMGKSTLCHAIAGMQPSSGGSIHWNGKTLHGRQPHEISREGVALVPQGRRVFRSLTVHEHMRLFAQQGGTNADKRWTIERVYDAFPRLAERKGSYGNQLSGGEQQMLAIGRALLRNPGLLVLDEPSEGLAPAVVGHLVELLRRVSRDGTRILLVEQNLGMAFAIAETVAILVAGRVAVCTSAQALKSDVVMQRQYLGVDGNAPRHSLVDEPT